MPPYLSYTQLAEIDPTLGWIERFGIAGVSLAILFWFLRALVNRGVVPFVKGTLENQGKVASTLATVEKGIAVTIEAVHEMRNALSEHVRRDEITDVKILEVLEAISDRVRK